MVLASDQGRERAVLLLVLSAVRGADLRPLHGHFVPVLIVHQRLKSCNKVDRSKTTEKSPDGTMWQRRVGSFLSHL